jgi:poly(3-hydroxybutyrate) depolymerase
MLGVRLARAGGLALASAALAPAVATAALPSVPSGQPPGPPILYAPAPTAPQLSVAAPFAASPLLVSGTDAYRNGEYIYQDYLFDDRGADTAPGLGSRPDNQDSGNFSPTAGDVQYPTAARYANNAADLVEFRIKPTATTIDYRITLNSIANPDDTVVGIGIDTDRSGGLVSVPWPNGAGIGSPGLDQFITAWGTGGEVRSLPGGATAALPAGSVSLDSTTKQMTISVPRTTMDPGTSIWRYVAGTGLWNSAGHSWKTPGPGSSPSAEQPVSGGPSSSSAVFNLAFRFDEPQIKQPDLETPPLPYSTFPGTGNWFEEKQSLALANDTTDASSAGVPAAGGDNFEEDVDFSKLAEAANEDIHAPKPTQARIFASSLNLPQGVKSSFPEYGGQLQPYVLHVPAGHTAGAPYGLTFALHSLGATYTQFAVFSPNQFTQLGDQRDNLVVTPLAHGPDGWYHDQGESDVFEVWADLDRQFNLDPDRSYVSGYSMGGYGTYKLGVEYPDLWAKAFTTVGPPGEGIWIPPADPTSGPETLTADLLGNVRWVPYLNWAGSTDELVPVVGPLAQQQRFDDLGLRSTLDVFAPADHFALAIVDQWAAARDFLGNATVTRDPSRVDYAFFPAADRPAQGLIHDHAYWVSGLEARDISAGDSARASISARSLAQGEGEPVTSSFSNTGAADKGPPLAYAETGTTWTSVPAVPAENALEAILENLSAGEIDGVRAGLDGTSQLRVTLGTDGASQLRLNLPLPPGTVAVRIDGGSEQPAPEVSVDATGAGFDLPSAGSRTYLLRPPAGSGGGNPPSSGAAPGAGSPRSASPAPPRCTGAMATIVGPPGNDRGRTAIRGTNGDDVIVALGGNDVVSGRGGRDVICGGPGADKLSGGGGKDRCYGGHGDDWISSSCELARSPGRR